MIDYIILMLYFISHDSIFTFKKRKVRYVMKYVIYVK